MSQSTEIIICSGVVRLEITTGSRRLAHHFQIFEPHEGVQFGGDDAVDHAKTIMEECFIPLDQMLLVNQMILISQAKKANYSMDEDSFNQGFKVYLTLRD